MGGVEGGGRRRLEEDEGDMVEDEEEDEGGGGGGEEGGGGKCVALADLNGFGGTVFGKRLAAVVRSKHSEAGTVIAAIKSEANRNATKAKRPKAERTVRPTTAKHTRTTAT